MLRKLSVVFVGLFISLCSSAFAADINCSSDMKMESKNMEMTSKYYIKGNKVRTEMEGRRGEGAITIMRGDKKVVWMLMPSQKMYMEMAYKEDTASKLRNPKTVRTLVGADIVSGHPTKKYHVTVIEDDGKKNSGYAWQATDLQDMLIKFQSEDKETTMTWMNIKPGGGSDDSLYEVPAGYKKMDMPSMPGTGGGGRHRR